MERELTIYDQTNQWNGNVCKKEREWDRKKQEPVRQTDIQEKSLLVMTKESQVTNLFLTINFKEDFLGGGETSMCHAMWYLG